MTRLEKLEAVAEAARPVVKGLKPDMIWSKHAALRAALEALDGGSDTDSDEDLEALYDDKEEVFVPKESSKLDDNIKNSIISDWLEENPNPEVEKKVEESLAAQYLDDGGEPLVSKKSMDAALNLLRDTSEPKGFKGTPGEWGMTGAYQIGPNVKYTVMIYRHADGVNPPIIVGYAQGNTAEEAEANARLIVQGKNMARLLRRVNESDVVSYEEIQETLEAAL